MDPLEVVVNAVLKVRVVWTLVQRTEKNVTFQTNAAATNGPRKLAKHVQQQQQPKPARQVAATPEQRSEWAAFEPKLEGWRAALKEEALDIDDQADPNEVPDYAFIAFEYFRAREGAQPVMPYLHKRKEINDRMRQVLVDWLVEVCFRCDVQC